MCGICGIYNSDGEPIDRRVLEGMTEILSHRGPDDFGVYVDGSVGLGHRRLSILDLSKAGHQPMVLEDRSVAISYNGEIYNYPTLRRELESRGHHFRSRTDTEMVLRAYVVWGIQALERFNGMFAMALWDAGERCLYLIRDRLGVKPIYYYRTPRRLIFGSEIKALLMHPEVRCCVNATGVAETLRFRYVLEPDTVFEGIQKVRAGHYVRIRGPDVVEAPWWDVEFRPEPEFNRRNAVEELGFLLESAVQMRRLSDVPVGAFLSGGVDSSTVVSMLCANGEPTQTFSVGFGGDSGVDEAEHAARVASALKTVHTDLSVKAPDVDLLRRVLWHLEEPIIDPAVFPTYALSQLAARHVKVVLTGEGSDEVNGGYERYRRAALAHRLGRLRFLEFLGLIGGRFPSFRRFQTLYEAASAVRQRRFSLFGFPEPLVTSDLQASVDDARVASKLFPLLPSPAASTSEFLNGLFYLDVKTWLPADLLIKVDKMSMAHSLEARTPYLDYRLVEFCAGVPPNEKVDLFRTKKLFRRVAASRLPKWVATRRQHGFLVPLERWLLSSLKEGTREILADSAGRELFDGDRRRAGESARSLFARVLLKVWYRVFFIDRLGVAS